MTGTKYVWVSAELLAVFLRGQVRECDTNCPDDVRIVAASFDPLTSHVRLTCESKEWAGQPLGNFDVICNRREVTT